MFSDERPFTGRHMLLLMLAFFGIVIGVNIFMAVKASTSWTGLLARNGYAASIDFARDKRVRQLALERGWQVDVEPSGAFVEIRAVDRNGAPLPIGTTASAQPADPRRKAIPLTLAQTADGAVSENPLAPGTYAVRVDIGAGKDALDWRGAVVVRP